MKKDKSKIDEDVLKEIDARAAFQQRRNDAIRAKRVQTAEKIAAMSPEEKSAYYENLRKENDEFLKELGIDPARIRKD